MEDSLNSKKTVNTTGEEKKAGKSEIQEKPEVCFSDMEKELNAEIDREISGIVEEVDREISKIEIELEGEAAGKDVPLVTEESIEKDVNKEDMQEMYENTFIEITEGTIIEGEVVRIDNDGVSVSIGYKNDGVIPLNQLSHSSFTSPEEVVKLGDKVTVHVIKVEDDEGRVVLSKKRADLEQAWLRVTNAYKNQTVLTATAIEQVKGGLIVDLGLRGFVPASQILLKPVRNLDDFVGEELRLKVIDLDRSRRKVVLSQKKVLQEERSTLKEKTLSAIQEGQILPGRVARVTNFGAFVNLGGVDGLVHISELSWKRIKRPSEVVKVGDEVEVMVLAVSNKKDRISLSLKQAQPDPWQVNIQNYGIGDVVEGIITKIAKNYIFVETEPGIEGLVRMSEVCDDREAKISDLFSENQKVKVKVLDIKPVQRRMTLSIKQAKEDPLDKETRSYMDTQAGSGVTLGDLLSMNNNKEEQE